MLRFSFTPAPSEVASGSTILATALACNSILILPFDKVLEHTRARRVSQFPEGLHFNLSDAFTRHLKIFAHFFQRPLAAFVIQPKSQANDFLFARAEGLQHIAGDVAQVRVDDLFAGAGRRFVFDQIPELRISALADRSFKRDWLLR